MSKCVRAEMCSRRSTRGARATSTTSPASSGRPNCPSNVSTTSDCGSMTGLSAIEIAGGQHEGTVGERVRRDRRQHERIDARMHDRSAGREVVGRRSGRGRDDESVGFDVAHQLAIDGDVQLDHPRQRASGDDDVVQRQALGGGTAVPHHAAEQHQARLGRCAARGQRLERGRDLGAAHFGEEAEMAEVDAEDRRVVGRVRHGAGGVEQRAVSAKRDDDVDVVPDGRRARPSSSARRARRRPRCRARGPACSRGCRARSPPPSSRRARPAACVAR